MPERVVQLWYNYLYVWTETGGMKVLCLENTLTGAIGAREGGGGVMGPWHLPFFHKIFENLENPHK